MKEIIANCVRNVFRSLGLELSRYRPERFGVDPYRDLLAMHRGQEKPMVFDVGGNHGQSVKKLKALFPASTIHTFEPSPAAWPVLKEVASSFEGVHAWNLGVADQPGTLSLKENEHSDMSSFLSPSELAWGKVVSEQEVEVIDLSSFAASRGIEDIDILKSDTQGFDLNVMKGASGLFAQGRVSTVLMELNFFQLYEGLPDYTDVLAFMKEAGFNFVGFYDPHFHGQRLGWCDVMFRK